MPIFGLPPSIFILASFLLTLWSATSLMWVDTTTIQREVHSVDYLYFLPTSTVRMRNRYSLIRLSSFKQSFKGTQDLITHLLGIHRPSSGFTSL